ncbi:MAG: nascent polypeptide-associated complex protein [Candidatus Micrarchaeaceae archaeon]
MMPNMDPRMLKRMMDSMGIKNTNINVIRVILECPDKDIIIEGPDVSIIEAQGTKTYQITSGKISEKDKSKLEISEDDIHFVGEQTGVSDTDEIKKAIENSNGDIAQAILLLKNESKDTAG